MITIAFKRTCSIPNVSCILQRFFEPWTCLLYSEILHQMLYYFTSFEGGWAEIQMDDKVWPNIKLAGQSLKIVVIFLIRLGDFLVSVSVCVIAQAGLKG